MDKEIKEAFLNAVTRFTGVKNSDLVASTKDLEITDFNDLVSAVESTVISHNENKNEELKGKYTRQAHTKTEKLIKESLPNFQFSSNKQKDMFAELKEELENKGDTKDEKPFTISQALQLKEVQDYIQAEKEKYKDEHLGQFKNDQRLKELAVSKLKTLNANLSKDEKRQKLQIETTLKALKEKYKITFDEDGREVIKDKDGERIFDEKQSRFLEFDDLLKRVSPVDFLDETQQINTPPNPKGNGANVNNTFGFTSDELGKIGLSEFQKAESEGNPEKADFILQQMELNEQKNNS